MTINLAALKGKSQEELLAIIATMGQQAERKLSLKVTDKGGVSLYGLGRFPVTLYASQWDKLLAATDQVRAFVDANRSLLSTKD